MKLTAKELDALEAQLGNDNAAGGWRRLLNEVRAGRRLRREAPGFERCPYADIPGERPCKAHSYSGCSDDGTSPRAR